MDRFSLRCGLFGPPEAGLQVEAFQAADATPVITVHGRLRHVHDNVFPVGVCLITEGDRDRIRQPLDSRFPGRSLRVRACPGARHVWAANASADIRGINQSSHRNARQVMAHTQARVGIDRFGGVE
jgi:hypothetical protein